MSNGASPPPSAPPAVRSGSQTARHRPEDLGPGTVGLAQHTAGELRPGLLLVVPLGSTEQHGPHLPLGTDTIVAVALAERLASRRSDTVVAPAVPYGSSGEHASFPGTLSIGREATEHLVVELGRSADFFAGVVFVCGHGGNAEPLARAVATLRSDGRHVMAWFPSVRGGDAHAGRTETAMLLALCPGTVGEPVKGNTAPLGSLMPALTGGGVAAVSPNGVLGDARGATRAEGVAILDELTQQLVAEVDRWMIALSRS